MKSRFVNTALCLGLTLIASVAMAQGLPSETPQYSGQSPRFDRGLDDYRDGGNARRAASQRLESIRRDARDDLAVDHQYETRSVRVQDEMARKRAESLRANPEYILKTNQ